VELKDRFFEFCRHYPEAEDIDSIVNPAEIPTGIKIADFLLQQRTIVCEVKTLTNETAEKLAAYMHVNGIGPSQLSDGQHLVRDLFLKLEDGEAKYRKAITIITKPITDGLHHADKQIADTRDFFHIAKADGLLVILNDQVSIAGQPLIFERLGQRLGKTNDDGSLCYTNVSHVLHIGEKYTPGDADAHLNFSIANSLVPEQSGVAAFVQKFMADWAAFNGQTFTMAGPEDETLLKESQLFINIG